MEAIGLSAPNSLFATQEKALGTISQLAGLVKTFGMKVTIRELVIAGTTTERLATASAYYAAWYLAGAIGSLIVAADNFYACKAGANAAEQLHRFIAVSSLTVISPMIPFLLQYPELFDTSSPHVRHASARTRGQVMDMFIGLAVVVFIVVTGWLFTHWIGPDWFYAITGALSILALSWEVARLRKILREHGIETYRKRAKDKS